MTYRFGGVRVYVLLGLEPHADLICCDGVEGALLILIGHERYLNYSETLTAQFKYIS